MCCFVLFLILLHSCSQCEAYIGFDVEDLATNSSWVITQSSGCSTTCGLGIRTQRLCLLEADGSINAQACKNRKVPCLNNWNCGLQIQTVTIGQYLELDCLEEVIQALGHFQFMVSWHFARGIITTDNRIFIPRKVRGLDRVILNLVKEAHAGTYRCDVLDVSYRRIKRLYKGLKVLHPLVLSLNFEEGLSEWEKPEESNVTVVTRKLYPSSTVRNVVLLSLSISITMALIVFLSLFAFSYWKSSKRKGLISHEG